jgi:hypothetical protein
VLAFETVLILALHCLLHIQPHRQLQVLVECLWRRRDQLSPNVSATRRRFCAHTSPTCAHLCHGCEQRTLSPGSLNSILFFMRDVTSNREDGFSYSVPMNSVAFIYPFCIYNPIPGRFDPVQSPAMQTVRESKISIDRASRIFTRPSP